GSCRVAAGEVFGPEVLIGGAVAQHVINDREDRGGDGDGRLLRAAARFETQVLGFQVATFCARHSPRGLYQNRLEPRCALLDPSRTALAGALVKARDEPSPGEKMPRRWKPTHIDPDLGD